MDYSVNYHSKNDNIRELFISQKNNSKLLPWSEKYRPNNINGIVYHDKITNAVSNYIKNKKLPHLLFYGPPGTGKTSTIIAIAREYYKDDYDSMILVLNASEERGIETVRNRIKQFVITKGIYENSETPSFKLIILDEIDAMTEDAQAILRKVVEKYVSNVRFCFICNYLKKINPAIQSRCVIFRFNPIPNNIMYNFTTKICELENINITLNAINLIIKRSNGDMRKLLNVMQSLYMYNFLNKKDTNEKYISNYKNSIYINEKSVSQILSCPTYDNIYNMLIFIQENDIKNSYEYITNMVNENGISLLELINYVYEFCMESIINDNKNIIKFSNEKIIKIIKNMSILNENLSYCNNDNIQLTSFISLFYM